MYAACCSFQTNSLAAAASADSRRSRAAAVWPAATTLAGISVGPAAALVADGADAAGALAEPRLPAGTVGAGGGAPAGGPIEPGGSIIGALPPAEPIPVPVGAAAGAAGDTMPGCAAAGDTPPPGAADTGGAACPPPADRAGDGLAGAGGGADGIPPPIPAVVAIPWLNADDKGDALPAPETAPEFGNPLAAPGI
ncbi:Uncharacterised protein [Mycobacteroides abscessus subsp. massiliense]|nr:Uncharacterised protein [Mycobacteroides abscessus subsp. abscessus]SKM87272.1 Uncharacterised protein [Mycobacteroides abscessus subsp. massiliense]